MKKLGAILVAAAATVSMSSLTATTPVASATPAVVTSQSRVTDPQLIAELQRAAARRSQGRGSTTLPVEIRTTDLDGVKARVRALGGTVTGDVTGALVQAAMPASQVEALASSPGVDDVQYPRHSGRVPSQPLLRTDAVLGTGPTQGTQVADTGAALWQAAGHLGAGVKVGIVDFFDFSVWNTAENGPVPDAAHQFCSDSAPQMGICSGGLIANVPTDGQHGVAVAEILKDMAPSTELFVASVNTAADLQAAVDWFGANGVSIVNRSLGSPYDGAGDGTGPLNSVADSAVAKGITWFNSAGNSAQDEYLRRTVPSSLAANAYVDFNDGRADVGAGADTLLRIDSSGCYVLDGIRWANDWYLPANQRTDYSVEFWEPTVNVSTTVGPNSPDADHYNPSADQLRLIATVDADQRAGAAPLEAADQQICPTNTFSPYTTGGAISYIRVKRNAATPVGTTPDTLEISLGTQDLLELFYYDAPGSAGTPIVDSRNAGVVSVGAVDPTALSNPADLTSIAYYSSQGPTNDGRIKPDVTAPAGFNSATFAKAFQGTSAAAPTAAGVAALLQGAGLGQPGQGLAALVKHFVTDRGPAGADNAFGAGVVDLRSITPPPTTPATPTPGKYVPLAPNPERLLDTRSASHVGPAALTGPYAPQSIIEMNVLSSPLVPDSGVSAVAVNVTSAGAPNLGFVQAYPYLRAKNGATSTLNIATTGIARPNFAVVPVGADGKISVYLQAGGEVILDLLGYYVDNQTVTTDGRYVPLASPERWMDTRGQGSPLPASFGNVARKMLAGEYLNIPILSTSTLPSIADPATSEVEALVVNITAVGAVGGGFVRAFPGGASGAAQSNVNYAPGAASANTAIVPIGAGGAITLYTSQTVDVIVDVVGYITSGAAASSAVGTFVTITPTRVYDSRLISSPYADFETRVLPVAGGTTGVPGGVFGVSANFTAVAPTANGFLKVYPGSAVPPTSSLNFAAGKTVANGMLTGVNADGTVSAQMSKAAHLVIDVNGYFVAAPA